MRVSVFGLGYVGAVSCGCFAQDGHDVVGVDISEDKVRLINEGRSPIIEEEIGEIIALAVKAGKLRATTDAAAAVAETDLSVVSVGTPSNRNGSLGLGAIERVSEQIGAMLADKTARHIIVVRSTVLPGTVRNHVVPILERFSGKSCGVGFDICFIPEFLREGSSVRDHYDPAFTLIGCNEEEVGRSVAGLFEQVKGETCFSSIETAEMVKYVCNSFHALKVTFANEMGILAQSMDVDSHRVMELFTRDSKLNLSPRYLKPGFAFGGSCLPKDVRALMQKAHANDLDVPLVRAIMKSNISQIQRAIDLILSLKKMRISMLGLSFKAGTDDLRESPLVSVTEALIGKGFDVMIYDRDVSIARLVGANKDYIEKEIPHIASLMTDDLHRAVAHGEVLVIGNRSSEFDGLPDLLRKGQTVVDLVRVDGLADLPGIDYRGIAW